ncbi:MAG: hypothetical protein GXP31_13660 [Kiritimatiellaeota bacterium]|nr:hypothetical protein [Kiritimatiellota bacterium]
MIRSCAAGLVLLLVAGCATSPKEQAQGPIFFPRPPQKPRLQFLQSYSTEGDLGGGPSPFAQFIAGKSPPQREIGKPYGVALHQGKLYVCDTAISAVDILDLETRQMRYFAPSNDGRLVTPINIAIDHDGTRYIADTGRGQVLIFGSDGTFRGAIGKRSSAPVRRGHMAASRGLAPQRKKPKAAAAGLKPTDVAVVGNRLYVVDFNGKVVRVYDKETREPLFTIPKDPTDEDGKLFMPTNLAVDSQGRVYVSDIGRFCVQQYDPDGKFLRRFGAIGDRPGEFARPKGVGVDRQDRLYVVDAAAQVVQIFDADGKLLLFFGEPGSELALNLPAKVVLDYDNVRYFEKQVAPGYEIEYLVLVTNQYGSRKVDVYGFVRKR